MKKRFTIAIIQIFLLTTVVRGQQENLIFNGSLEDFSSCPNNASIFKAIGWTAGEPGGLSSTDYYHACAGFVPFYAKDGEGFFGAGYSIGWGDTTSGRIREFAAGKLVGCLTEGQKYRFSFFVNPPPNQISAWVGFNCFEVLFHSNEFIMDGQNGGLSRRFNEVAHRALKMSVNAPIIQRGVWRKLEVEFTATGDECYFTVGCFSWLRPENIDTLVGPGATGNVFPAVYYLYDDFVLTEIPDDTTPPAPEPVVPNVFTPNADGQNDYWVIKHLPPATSVAIYNRWGQRVYFSENYANDWGGEGLPSGTYIAELVFRDLPPKRQAVYLKRE